MTIVDEAHYMSTIDLHADKERACWIAKTNEPWSSVQSLTIFLRFSIMRYVVDAGLLVLCFIHAFP